MSSDGIIICQLCHVTFNATEDLSLHSCTNIKQEVKDYELPFKFKKSFICKICNKSFKDNYKLRRHEKVHNKGYYDRYYDFGCGVSILRIKN